MSLYVDDKVVVFKSLRDKEGRIGKVIDLKWNMILIRFDDGECDWIDSRLVKHK